MRSVLWFEEKPITPAVTQSISILVGEIDRNVRDPTLWISETQAQAGLKCALGGQVKSGHLWPPKTGHFNNDAGQGFLLLRDRVNQPNVSIVD